MKNKEMNAFSQKFIKVYFMLETLLRHEKAAVSTSMPLPDYIYIYVIYITYMEK